MDPLQAALVISDATSRSRHELKRAARPKRPARLVPTIRNAAALATRRIGALIATGRHRAPSPADPVPG